MIKSLFPKVRIVARDNVIKVLGDEEQIAKLEGDVENLRKHISKFNINKRKKIFLDIVNGRQTKTDAGKGVLVYSVSGKL